MINNPINRRNYYPLIRPVLHKSPAKQRTNSLNKTQRKLKIGEVTPNFKVKEPLQSRNHAVVCIRSRSQSNLRSIDHNEDSSHMFDSQQEAVYFEYKNDE